MKTTLALLILATALFSQLSFGRAKIPLPFGTKEKIIHTMDLPDHKAFQLADGQYYDIGSHYEIRHLFWLAYAHSKPQIVGYLGNSDAYVVLTNSELKAIKQRANIELAGMAEVGFMDKIGGKILLGALMLLALFGVYTTYFSRRASLEEEESIAF
ncbi:hypothetical protein FGM00_07055 [Aggregatimonas sangjinii]|uniref:DUF2167 domain-containing protein n=1 Tax=Aggregatimonas sangjinii TaxID=2583587 RepID=A0A5B7SS91_9FLAO|nr:hypothetical protein [Aggregatimonas sangjinii]QCW99867.1 hypothetical protein FGM00_07055 [Aggregatimonas sangjinii]